MSLPRPHDLEENGDGDEGSHQSPAAKRLRCSSCGDDKQMELLEEMRKMLQKQNEKLESMFQENQYLREKVSCLTADFSRLDGYLQQSPAPRMSSYQHGSMPLRLKFLNSCKNDKYSKHKIEADDKTPLKVAIYDHNNKIITSEPFSSMRVHIVPIQGDFDDDHKRQWTEEYFRSKIVTGRPGKECLLSGDLYIILKDGVGDLNTAKFQDNSSFVASKRFKLGVMAADERISQRIQEGITESFAVKDVRGYSTKKNLNPSPRDPVYKLRRIAKDGDRHKLLEQNGIKRVEDFVLSYFQSPENLRKIVGKISDRDWDMIINHALKCNLRPGNQEHETVSRSDGTCYLQGSSSMQPSPASQKQLDVHVTPQQSSSIYTELSSSVSLEDATRELVGSQVEEEQVSGVGNEVLSVSPINNNTLERFSSQQGRRSSECDIMLDDNTLWEFDDLDFCPGSLLEASCLGGSFSAFEEMRGRSPASEAGSSGSHMGYPGSPVMGAGSRSSRGLSFSPARGVGVGRHRRLSSSPARGPSSSNYWTRPPLPVRGADNISNTSTDFTDEEEFDLSDVLMEFEKSLEK